MSHMEIRKNVLGRGNRKYQKGPEEGAVWLYWRELRLCDER
jgi:hypothetical protein